MLCCFSSAFISRAENQTWLAFALLTNHLFQPKFQIILKQIWIFCLFISQNSNSQWHRSIFVTKTQHFCLKSLPDFVNIRYCSDTPIIIRILWCAFSEILFIRATTASKVAPRFSAFSKCISSIKNKLTCPTKPLYSVFHFRVIESHFSGVVRIISAFL